MLMGDVAIVGAGPAGLFASLECGLMGLDAVLIDTLSYVGGQCTTLYPEKPILDIPGSPEILAKDLIYNLSKQTEKFVVKRFLEHKILELYEKESFWHLISDKGVEFVSKAVIIATGGGAFEFNKIPLLEAAELEGSSLFYSVKNKLDFKDKTISIIGGGDAALDWTIELAEIATEINLIHRRDSFKAAPASLDKLRTLVESKKVKLFTPFQLHSINSSNKQISFITLQNLKNDAEEINLNTDVLLAFLGLSSGPNKLKQWGLDIFQNKLQVSDVDCSTNLRNVFAVGDIAYYSGKINSLLAGFAEGARVARCIQKSIYPDRKQLMYSTSLCEKTV